jgi:hypothetical protein
MLQSKAGYIDARPQSDSSTKTLATHGRTIHWVIPSREQQFTLALPLHDRNGADRIRR